MSRLMVDYQNFVELGLGPDLTIVEYGEQIAINFVSQITRKRNQNFPENFYIFFHNLSFLKMFLIPL